MQTLSCHAYRIASSYRIRIFKACNKFILLECMLIHRLVLSFELGFSALMEALFLHAKTEWIFALNNISL